jgi:hypothetical protein
MSSEKYQSTPEDLKRAEERMTPEEKRLSEQRAIALNLGKGFFEALDGKMEELLGSISKGKGSDDEGLEELAEIIAKEALLSKESGAVNSSATNLSPEKQVENRRVLDDIWYSAILYHLKNNPSLARQILAELFTQEDIDKSLSEFKEAE